MSLPDGTPHAIADASDHPRPRVLLIASTTGYQVREFANAAERLGIELVFATDRCHVLQDPWGDAAIPLRFTDVSSGLDTLVEIANAPGGKFDGIVAVGDRPAFVASQAAPRLGLRFSSPDSVAASGNKFLARERFRAAGLLVPNYALIAPGSTVHTVALSTRYPCVLKPLGLAGSRGVIRANHADEFVQAFARIRKILDGAQSAGTGHLPAGSIQVEDFIPGREFALEGLVTDGRLQVLAIFDKPDPLDGPYFEETIYRTPSHEPESIQREIVRTTERAVTALGLTSGPIHAEMRVNESGVWMLEVAARPIGGLCSRVLRFDRNRSLEELILLHALGPVPSDEVSSATLSPGSHGVMMIPIPQSGVYQSVDGLEDARAVPGIEDVVITAKEGQMLEPLPEGASYLGFIFCHSARDVEPILRASHRRLSFRLNAAFPVVR